MAVKAQTAARRRGCVIGAGVMAVDRGADRTGDLAEHRQSLYLRDDRGLGDSSEPTCSS